MGRRPTRNLNVPTGIRPRHRKNKTYYYLEIEGRKEIPLGSDFIKAVEKWTELNKGSTKAVNVHTFKTLSDRYSAEALPKKAPRTQRDNLKELEWLSKFFCDPRPAPLDKIKPMHVRQYLDWRKDAPIRANREKSLLSHMWNFALNTGMTEKINPCTGIKGFPESGRDTYIDDGIYKVVWSAAEAPLQDAMDLAYLTGQRPADVLKLTRRDIVDGAIVIEQNKTGKRLRIAIEGELAAVVQRITSRHVAALMLVSDAEGRSISAGTFRGMFDRAREKAIADSPAMADSIKAFQFRDLRAKAGTDREERDGMEAAQNQLGHANASMTAHYVRHRKGKLVRPTK